MTTINAASSSAGAGAPAIHADLFGENTIINTRPRNLADLLQLQKALKIRNRNCLLGMSSTRDPFNAGSLADIRDAEWFANQWEYHGFVGACNIHLRKLHYRIVSLGENIVPLPRSISYKMDGEEVVARTYKNHIPVWKYLTESGTKARYLGLVPPDAFVDRRNPNPTINAKPFWTTTPSWSMDKCDHWLMPSIKVDLSGDMDWQLPWGFVEGYTYDIGNQPYLIEVWCEKSTMDDVLEPICSQYGANYVTAKGFQSITAAINILQRAKQCAMPTRILYISDFDPAGDKMAPSVARQIEFWFEQYAPGVEVKVDGIVLTPEQVQHYKLPGEPIKKSDKRAKLFLERYGVKGAVELDALDTLHPGELEKIVTQAIQPYRDWSLPKRLQDAEDDAQRLVDNMIYPVRHAAMPILHEIRNKAKAILSRYEERLSILATELAEEFAPLQTRMDTLRHQVDDELEAITIDLPPRPIANIEALNESQWLFDSSRDYLSQLAFYKKRHDSDGEDDNDDDVGDVG